MTPVVKGGAAVGGVAAVAAGGYGAKVLIDGKKPYTLADVEKYKTGASATKFGGKFAAYLLSDEEAHKKHNRPYWEVNVKRLLAPNTAALATDGFLNSVTSKKTEYTSANTATDKNSKFNALVNALITSCKAKYEESTFNTDSEASKWQEYWKYCSIDGVDRWAQQKTPAAK